MIGTGLSAQVPEAEHERIGDAIRRHYVEHGLPADGGESDPWFRVHIGPITLRLPNPPARRRAVFFHDVNHIVAGYNTVFSEGEMAIAAFEVGSGCGPFAIVWYINLSMFGLGVFVTPTRVYPAFVRGRRARSIYRRSDSRDTLSALTVRELRDQLQLDRLGSPPQFAEKLAFGAWAAVAVVAALAPFVAIGFGLRALVALLRA